jgi:hypothetical protein
MNLLKKSLIASVISMASISANAELISIDLNVEGDNLVTLDTQTGLEWLDISLTNGRRHYDIQGGAYGFRIPTNEEVDAFFTNNITSVSNPFVHGPVYHDGDNSEFMKLSTFLGSNLETPQENIKALGMYRDEHGQIEFFGGDSTYMYGLDSDYGLTFTSRGYGSLLISEGGVSHSSILNPSINIAASASSVSVPATLGLLGLAIAGLSFRRKSA